MEFCVFCSPLPVVAAPVVVVQLVSGLLVADGAAVCAAAAPANNNPANIAGMVRTNIVISLKKKQLHESRGENALLEQRFHGASQCRRQD
jgi:hypothetical protein